VTDASAQPQAPAKTSDLRTRVISALVMAPPVLAAVWWGGIPFLLVLALAGFISLQEWTRLVAPQGHRRAFVVLFAGFAATAAVLALAISIEAGAEALAVGMLITALVSKILGAAHKRFALLALPYVAGGCLALGWLRVATGEDGLGLFLFVLLVIWATDIGAYFSGKTIGGPKLLPRVSPKKTWAGLIGGMIAAALVGSGVALVFGAAQPAIAALVGALTAVVGQAGDLLESYAKRRSDVKDSGSLIPGHGGLLDRIDGLLSAAIAVALFHAFFGESLAWW